MVLISALKGLLPHQEAEAVRVLRSLGQRQGYPAYVVFVYNAS